METIKNIIAYIIYYFIKYIVPSAFVVGAGVIMFLYSVYDYSFKFLEIF